MGKAPSAHLADGATGVDSAEAAGGLAPTPGSVIRAPEGPPACPLCFVLRVASSAGPLGKGLPWGSPLPPTLPLPPAPRRNLEFTLRDECWEPCYCRDVVPGWSPAAGLEAGVAPCPRVADPQPPLEVRAAPGRQRDGGHGAQGAGDGHGCAGSSPLGTSVLSRPQRWPCWADSGPRCWRPLRSHGPASCMQGHLDRSSPPFGRGGGRPVQAEERRPQRRAQGTSRSHRQARGRVGQGRLFRRGFHFTSVSRSCCHKDT